MELGYENGDEALHFMQTGSEVLDNAWRTMAMHPKYMDSFLCVHQYLMRGDGPLRYKDRHYIAMMAASRHYCPELVEYHRKEFQGFAEREEDASALQGLDKATARLQNLDKLNRLLAHRPWTITKEIIRELISSPDGTCGKWSMSELIQAIILLAHFHSFSSFVLGCGKLKGLKDRKARGRNAQSISDAQDAIAAATAAAHAAILPGCGEITVDDEDDDDDGGGHSGSNGSAAELGEVPAILRKMETLSARKEELGMSELARRFDRIDQGEEEDQADSAACKTPRATPVVPDSVAFTRELVFKYVDFVRRDNPTGFPTVRYTDLNWDDHVYPTIRQLYNEEISQLLDDKFSIIQSLTYMTIGRYTSVDTTMFRRAVQNYIQCLYGIRHDDYDYAEVNELLPRPLKKYIKTVCCYAETCTLEEYSSIMTDFLESEKVHVCLLVCEARFQASLLYACRAVSKHFSGSP